MKKEDWESSKMLNTSIDPECKPVNNKNKITPANNASLFSSMIEEIVKANLHVRNVKDWTLGQAQSIALKIYRIADVFSYETIFSVMFDYSTHVEVAKYDYVANGVRHFEAPAETEIKIHKRTIVQICCEDMNKFCESIDSTCRTVAKSEYRHIIKRCDMRYMSRRAMKSIRTGLKTFINDLANLISWQKTISKDDILNYFKLSSSPGFPENQPRFIVPQRERTLKRRKKRSLLEICKNNNCRSLNANSSHEFSSSLPPVLEKEAIRIPEVNQREKFKLFRSYNSEGLIEFSVTKKM